MKTALTIRLGRKKAQRWQCSTCAQHDAHVLVVNKLKELEQTRQLIDMGWDPKKYSFRLESYEPFCRQIV